MRVGFISKRKNWDKYDSLHRYLFNADYPSRVVYTANTLGELKNSFKKVI